MTAIQGHSMTYIANKIYIFGGFYHGRYLNSLYCVDLEEQEVLVIEPDGPIPENKAYHAYFNNSIVFY